LALIPASVAYYQARLRAHSGSCTQHIEHLFSGNHNRRCSARFLGKIAVVAKGYRAAPSRLGSNGAGRGLSTVRDLGFGALRRRGRRLGWCACRRVRALCDLLVAERFLRLPSGGPARSVVGRSGRTAVRRVLVSLTLPSAKAAGFSVHRAVLTLGRLTGSPRAFGLSVCPAAKREAFSPQNR
jgi:hypothetical protein